MYYNPAILTIFEKLRWNYKVYYQEAIATPPKLFRGKLVADSGNSYQTVFPSPVKTKIQDSNHIQIQTRVMLPTLKTI